MKRAAIVATATMVIGALAACSSEPADTKTKRGTLPPGTVQLSINDTDAPTAGPVRCWTVETLTTITTGNDASGATVMISNAEKPAVEFVTVRDVGGFTGNYNAGLEGKATVTMIGSTYDITGTANGYRVTSTEPTITPFHIKAAC
ncbi:lipoprotein LpqH [Mycobacterium paraintracellulare]|uniref:lipoprotein LpqH n=1 Tax=Mycobacterium paraintracellulare TaxID=1138383 RepID=UPI001927045D|nr:lipoprotein LpqH [Mycobacterium paraintracellulare]